MTYEEAWELASSFEEVTPENIEEILKTITLIYIHHGDCSPVKKLIDLVATHYEMI